MSSKHSLSVSLTEHLCAFVDEQVASGRFRSGSEVVRAALRLLERDLQTHANDAHAEQNDDPGKPPQGSPSPSLKRTRSSGPERVP